MQYLRQAAGTGAGTGPTISIGPCLDSTGAEYAGLVIGDLTLTKNGTSAAMAANATLTATSNGHYDLVMIGNNVDTLGRLRIRCNKATYQIPPLEFEVLPAATFDALVTNAAGGASGLPILDANSRVSANVTAWVGTTAVAGAIPAIAAGSVGGLGVLNANSMTECDVRYVRASPVGVFAGGNFNTFFNNGNANSAATVNLVQTLSDRVGAFTGSGVNTILGMFKALFSKVATLPSDVGGTFSPATDSVEALRDRGDAAWITAAGFAVAGDAMTLTPAERTATANVLEAAILDEGDATALLAAIAAKVEEFLINEGDAVATLAAIAAAVNSAVVAGQVGTDAAAAKTAAEAVKVKTDQLVFSGGGVESNVVAFDGNMVVMQLGYDSMGGVMVPAVSANVNAWHMIPSDQFFHPSPDGIVPPMLHAHVHGMEATIEAEIAAAVRTELTAELAVLTELDGMIVGGVYTAAALANAPAGGGGGSGGGLTTEEHDWLDLIQQKTSLITAGKTTIVSPLGPSGLITLIQGFDWPVSDNAGIVVEEPYVAAWPSYIDTAPQHLMFAVKKDGTEEFQGTGEVLTPLGDGRRRLGYSIVKDELTDWPGKYKYYLGCVLASGNRVAFSSGELTLERGPSI